MDKFKFFSQNEICNPSIDGNPAEKWYEIPKEIRDNLLKVLFVANEIQLFLKQNYGNDNTKMTLTSTWRPEGRKTSAHFKGKALDFQIFNRKSDNIYLHIMDFLVEKNFNDLRAILEWRGHNPWIHIDRHFKETKVVYMTAYPPNYPNDTKMYYTTYAQRLPQKYVKI